MPLATGDAIVVKLRAELTQLRAGLTQAQGEISKFKTGANAHAAGAAKGFKQVGIGAIASAAVIGGAFAKTISTASDFEQKMAAVISVTGAVGDEFDIMKDKALEMGATTSFTAREAADAMYYLGSAGYNAEQVASSLEGTLKLAEATQHDLAETTQITVATLNQFGIEAEHVNRVGNVFAATIKGSQATMQRLGTSMAYVGPVAAAAGRSLEETSAVLGKLFSGGLNASMAGTSLRRILLNLIKPTNAATKAMGKYGISLNDLSPEVNSIADIIDVLNEKQIRTADLAEIFGTRGVAAIKILQSQGGDALREFQGEVTNTNAAFEMAEIQLDTTRGAIKLMKSAIEGASISIGSALAPAVRFLAEGIKNLFTLFNMLPGPIKSAIAITLGLAGAFKVLKVAMLALNINPIILGITAATIAIGGLLSLINRARERTRLLEGEVTAADLGALQKLANEEEKAIEKARKRLNDLLNEQAAAASTGAKAYQEAKQQGEDVNQVYSATTRAVKETEAEMKRYQERLDNINARIEIITDSQEDQLAIQKQLEELQKLQGEADDDALKKRKQMLESFYQFVLGRDELARRELKNNADELLLFFKDDKEKKLEITRAYYEQLNLLNLQYIANIVGQTSGLVSELGSLYNMSANNQIASINKEKEAAIKALDARGLSDKKYNKARDALDKKFDEKSKRIQLRNFRRQKKINIAEALMNTFTAFTKALTAAPPPFNVLLAAGTLGLGLGKVKLIKSQPEPFARGGQVGGRFGKDKNIIKATRGEYIVNPTASSRNLALLDYINKTNRSILGYFQGGLNAGSIPAIQSTPPMKAGNDVIVKGGSNISFPNARFPIASAEAFFSLMDEFAKRYGGGMKARFF